MRSRLAIVVSYVALSCCALPQALRKVASIVWVSQISAGRRWLYPSPITTLEFDYESGAPPQAVGAGTWIGSQIDSIHTYHRGERELAREVSGCAPFISVMETADLRDSYNPSKLWWLHSPRFRRVLTQ